jgi:hypothetical protein
MYYFASCGGVDLRQRLTGQLRPSGIGSTVDSAMHSSSSWQRQIGDAQGKWLVVEIGQRLRYYLGDVRTRVCVQTVGVVDVDAKAWEIDWARCPEASIEKTASMAAVGGNWFLVYEWRGVGVASGVAGSASMSGSFVCSSVVGRTRSM